MYDIFMTTGVVDTAKPLCHRTGVSYDIAATDQDIRPRLLSNNNTQRGIHTYGILRIGDLYSEGKRLLRKRDILDVMPLWSIEQAETDIVPKVIDQIPELLDDRSISTILVATERMRRSDGTLVIPQITRKRFDDGKFRISSIRANDESYFTSNTVWLVKMTMPDDSP